MRLGDWLRSRRQELGLTMAALARQAGISKSFLCDVERNKRSVGAETLLALGRVLNVSLDELMSGTATQAQELAFPLPLGLTNMAQDRDLSFRHMVCLYWLMHVIQDHKAPPRRTPLAAVDWVRFYEAVAEFL